MQDTIRLLDLTIDPGRNAVSRDGQAIDLPDLSFRLLAALIRHAPDTVNKDDLIREVWGDVVVGDETLAQRIRLLRQALDDDAQNPRYFSSVRGRGYRLLCPVQEGAEATPQSRIKRPLVAVAIVLIVTAAFGLYLTLQVPPISNAIAVLPFKDLSADTSYQHFADGMQEELLSRLANIEEINVTSRTTVEPYRASALSITEIAAEIGVTALIEGSVRVDNDRIRITIQLIDAVGDQHLWADSFERTLSVQSIFSIQDEVAQRIAASLETRYGTLAKPNSVQLPTGDIDAYSMYLLGRFHTFRQTSENLALAVEYLTQATQLDPDFAEAYAALGWAYSFLGTSYGDLPPHEAYPRAREAALNALALDSELADARTLYADILTWYDWDFATAEREYRRTLELDPGNVLGYALFLSVFERHDEAIELIERRLQADPDEAYVRVNAAWRLLNARRYERAIEQAELAANHPDARAALGKALLHSGNTERAIRVLEDDLETRGRLAPQLSNLAVAYFDSGQRVVAQELLAELEQMAQSRFVSPALLAAAYFAAGDEDRGFASLQRALQLKVRGVIFLRVNEMLDGRRDDPRYLQLVRAAGLMAE